MVAVTVADTAALISPCPPSQEVGVVMEAAAADMPLLKKATEAAAVEEVTAAVTSTTASASSGLEAAERLPL